MKWKTHYLTVKSSQGDCGLSPPRRSRGRPRGRVSRAMGGGEGKGQSAVGDEEGMVGPWQLAGRGVTTVNRDDSTLVFL